MTQQNSAVNVVDKKALRTAIQEVKKIAVTSLKDGCTNAVNTAVDAVSPAMFTSKKLESKSMKNKHGRRKAKLKVAKKFLNTECRVQSREASRGYSKERTAELIGLASGQLDKANFGVQTATTKVGVGVGTLVRPFRNAWASLRLGVSTALAPQLAGAQESSTVQS